MLPGIVGRVFAVGGENIMARKSIEERLAQLDAQRQTLKARLGKQERARDTRRKVLLGALILHRLSEDKREFDRALREWLQRELPGFLSRPDDKALFDDLLKPVAEPPSPPLERVDASS